MSRPEFAATARGPRIVRLMVLLSIVSIAFYVNTGLARGVARHQPFPPPEVTADAVYVIDATSQTELFAMNADEPLATGSLTKVVAALVVLEQADLDDTVTIEQSDLVSLEESQVGLQAGDILTVRDLLYGLLIPSGNDAAIALARHIGRSHLGENVDSAKAVAYFANLMNDKARSLGATASHFVNPTGMDADGHVMSARDVATVTIAALDNPLFAEIVATPNAVLTSKILPDGYAVTSTNLLLLDGTVDGGKTGTSPQAGGCFVSTFRVGPNQIVSVVLGSDVVADAEGFQDNSARFSDTKALMTAVNQDYVWIDPAAPGQIAGLLDELRVWDVSFVGASLLPVPIDQAAEVRYRLILAPPTAPQEVAGEVQFLIDETLLSERPAFQVS